jgi:uncharacterized protein (DUF169 family)
MMSRLDDFHEYAKEFRNLLRLKTFPLAVRLLEGGGDIPKSAKRPTKDLGYRLSLCQGFSMSRREKIELAMLKDDMWCFEPIVGLGLAEPPKYFLDGYNRFPITAKTLEAGSKWARGMPRLEIGKNIGIVFGPLETADFEPDLLITYCDGNQITHLLRAVNCIDGNDIISQLSGHAGCVYATVPVIKTRKYHICSLCRGDRGHAMAQDDEMIFTAPKEKLNDLMEGLKYLADHNLGLPIKLTLQPEYQFTEPYEKIARMLGVLR